MGEIIEKSPFNFLADFNKFFSQFFFKITSGVIIKTNCVVDFFKIKLFPFPYPKFFFER